MKVVPVGDLAQGSSAQETERYAVEARLRRRIDALGIIIAGAAHEFNNVVMAVQAGARMARKRADRPGEVDRIAGMMEAAADRGARLTASLLAFARRDEGSTTLFEVRGSLIAVADLLKQTLGLAIEVDCPKGLPVTRGDQGEFETVLVHLLIGLRKPTAKNGALRIEVDEVSCGSSDPTLGLRPGPYLRLSVVVAGANPAGPEGGPDSSMKDPEASASAAKAFCTRNQGTARVDSNVATGTNVTLWLATDQGAAARSGRVVLE